jgi:hypothetical protein
MKAVQGYYLIKPEDLSWRPSNLMKIPNADYLERTGSENLGAAQAVAAEEREHGAQAHPRGGVLFCARRRGPHARRRQNVDRAEIRGDLRNVVFGRVKISVPSIVFVSCCRKFIVPD